VPTGHVEGDTATRDENAAHLAQRCGAFREERQAE
jgi:hypothetical protein